MTNIMGVVGAVAILAVTGWSLDELYVRRSHQDEDGAREFVAAAKRGDENAVRRALESDSTLAHAVDAQGMTALDWAATRLHWHIFAQLLDNGAPITRVGADGGTVLHRVAHYDRPDIMQLLVDAGGDITTQNRWGRSPLHVAARRGCPAVASLLIDVGADLHATTNEGWTPLHVAFRAGQPEIVELLLNAGADPNRRDAEGLVPADHEFERPLEIPIEETALFEYQGLFDVVEHFHFKVWVEGGRLMLQDFGPDELYATGPDSFYCRSEPWSVNFSRNESGQVNEIEVHFLRRAVHGSKRNHPLYVGSEACRSCHIRQEHGSQFLPWVSSRHGAAYWRLATQWSLELARFRPHFQDMENPQTDSRCLLCHVTGAQDPDALFAASFEKSEGIGCESCHGPGSLYMASSVMSNHEAFVAAGGRTPSEETCRGCHRNPDTFSFDEWWPRIAHGGPGG